MGFFDYFTRDKKKDLDEGLKKTKEGFFDKIKRAVAGKSRVDESFLDELEEILITSDVGLETTVKIIERLEKRVAKDKYFNTEELNQILRDEIGQLLEENQSGDNAGYELPVQQRPYVIMVVGVNGAGKTTTIGKLANQYKQKGMRVMLGAADTFRAAAIEQLAVWAERSEVDIVKKEPSADPSAVAYECLEKGKSNGSDVIIIDTAGRLHNKVGLMNELSKIRRVMQKVIPDAPHEVLLVLDGSTGQNAMIQAREFTKATEVTAIAITKLDGTAKGGVVIGISDQFKIPVKYIGVGEKIDQLQLFNRKAFVESLFS